MRTILACSLVAAGCGGNGGLSTNADMAVPLDLTVLPDLTMIPDLAQPPVMDMAVPVPDSAGLQCGPNGVTCGPNQVCCGTLPDGGMVPQLACANSCPDGGIPVTCDGPEDCPAERPYCCANFMVGAGQPPLCPIQSAAASCKKTCDLVIPNMCPGSGQAKFCHRGADCQGGGGDRNCCSYMGITACVPDIVKMFAQCQP